MIDWLDRISDGFFSELLVPLAMIAIAVVGGIFIIAVMVATCSSPGDCLTYCADKAAPKECYELCVKHERGNRND